MTFRQIIFSFETVLGLFIFLNCYTWCCLAVGQKNGESFQKSLKDFAKVAEGLTAGLKTVAKAAQIISGEIDLGSGEECIFSCKNGATPRKKIGYIPQDNGCGAYGFKVDLSKLPEMEHCCSQHDRCYSHCGKEKDACDLKFSKCLEKVCNRLLHTIGLNDEESEGCMMTVQLMYVTVLELGCEAYLLAQKEGCICQPSNGDVRSDSKAKPKRKLEL